MEKIPITVVILTINDEPHLPELLDSIQPYVEDIFIVDSRSTDRTIDIALERGVKIVQRAFTTPPEQYAWAFKNLPIKTEWLFSMDQDERFSSSLVEELKTLFAKGIPDDVDGYTVKWRYWFMGQPLHAMSDNFRLMRTKKCWVSEVTCNEHFCVPGKILHLKGILEHKDVLNLHEWYQKQNLWTTLEAVAQIRDHSKDEAANLFGTAIQRKVFFRKILRHLPFIGRWLSFAYYYFNYGAWHSGYAGYKWACMRLWTIDVVRLKVREMRKIGVPKILPTALHGDFDPRVLATELQRQLLPETCR